MPCVQMTSSPMIQHMLCAHFIGSFGDSTSFVHAFMLALQLKQSKRYLRDGKERFKEALTILDYRFFLIPLMFALLRMWTCMLFIFEIYVQLSGVPPVIKLLIFYLSVSFEW